MNMDDLCLGDNNDANEATAHHASKHFKIPEAALASPVPVTAHLVKFSPLKALQSDQIKTRKADVYSPLLTSALYQSVRHFRYLWLGPS